MTLTLFLLAILGAAPASGSEAASRPIDFTREVRPILSGHCFHCHGPDARARKGHLRLDDRPGATQELPSGNRAIVPGDAGTSVLIERLTTDDESQAMPPRKAGNRLTEKDVVTLRLWIHA